MSWVRPGWIPTTRHAYCFNLLGDSKRMLVRDLMTAHPVAALPADSIVTAARTMRDRDVGMLPVVDAFDTMQLVGVITDRDIATRCVANGHVDACLVAEHMTSFPLHAVRPTDDVTKVAGLMQWAKVRRIAVIDDTGTLIGVISQADFATNATMQDLRLMESALAGISAPRRRVTNHVIAMR